MLKIGQLFFSACGRIGKIVGEFNYGDGFKYIGAIWDGTKLVLNRYNDAGQANDTAGHNISAPIEDWINFYHFTLKYNLADKSWEGIGTHHTGAAVLNVKIVKYEEPAKVLGELQKVAYEKMLEYLKPIGYPLVMEDVQGE